MRFSTLDPKSYTNMFCNQNLKCVITLPLPLFSSKFMCKKAVQTNVCVNVYFSLVIKPKTVSVKCKEY